MGENKIEFCTRLFWLKPASNKASSYSTFWNGWKLYSVGLLEFCLENLKAGFFTIGLIVVAYIIASFLFGASLEND